MIKDYIAKVKKMEGEILLIFVIFTIAITGFALGVSSAKLTELENRSQSAAVFVGSKEGTVYHLMSCAGAKSIKEENKIFFSAKEEAEKAGYRPAANCPGLN